MKATLTFSNYESDLHFSNYESDPTIPLKSSNSCSTLELMSFASIEVQRSFHSKLIIYSQPLIYLYVNNLIKLTAIIGPLDKSEEEEPEEPQEEK